VSCVAIIQCMSNDASSVLGDLVSGYWSLLAVASLVSATNSYVLHTYGVIDPLLLAILVIIAFASGYFHFAHARESQTSKERDTRFSAGALVLLIVNIVFVAVLYEPLAHSLSSRLSLILFALSSFFLLGRSIGALIEWHILNPRR